VLRAVAAARPEESLRALFEHDWPAYRRWFLRDGESQRPTYLECERALSEHMPELLPTWQRIVEAVGGTDLQARFLSLWRPRPYLAGCSQAVWTRGAPFLIRNYDYHPALWDGTLLCSAWSGRRVLAMTDCLWGVLDGVNDAGLSVALSFGGRRALGVGFGMPIILRYVLETCERAEEAVEVLERVPTHMAYNVTVLDIHGTVRTVRASPDRPPETSAATCATNHQNDEWPEYALATRSVEREDLLRSAMRDPGLDAATFAENFLRPPLRGEAFARGRGTLYTAIYKPAEASVTLRWPGLERTWSLHAFDEEAVPLTFGAATAPSAHENTAGLATAAHATESDDSQQRGGTHP
jgi:predicted choloylglycine hydrolase